MYFLQIRNYNIFSKNRTLKRLFLEIIIIIGYSFCSRFAEKFNYLLIKFVKTVKKTNEIAFNAYKRVFGSNSRVSNS